MSLTSNSGYQGDYQEALTRLTESCREASAVLFDVMSVVWMRIRDSKGMQWKHGLYALHILRNLILHGPLAAVAEATDGLDKIRALKSHSDSLRPKQAQQVREAATQVYSLLVDRAMLFWARRVCANARRVMKNSPQAVAAVAAAAVARVVKLSTPKTIATDTFWVLVPPAISALLLLLQAAAAAAAQAARARASIERSFQWQLILSSSLVVKEKTGASVDEKKEKRKK